MDGIGFLLLIASVWLIADRWLVKPRRETWREWDGLYPNDGEGEVE